MELVISILILWMLLAYFDFFKALAIGFFALVGVIYAVEWIQTTSVTNLSYLFIVFMAIVVLRTINTHR